MFSFFSPENFDLVYETKELVVGNLKTTRGTARKGQTGSLAVYADSVTSYLNFLSENCPEPMREGASSSQKADDDDFYYFKTYEEAMDTFRFKPHTLVDFDPSDINITLRPSEGLTVEFDVWGDYLDIDKHLEGVPEVYGQNFYGQPRRVFANIYLLWNVNSFVGEEVINHRSKRVMRLIDWLESHQIRVSLTIVRCNVTMVSEIRIKHYDESLEIATIAAATNSDFFRRMCFRAAEYSPTWQRGYGQAHTLAEYGTLSFDDTNALNIAIDSFTEIKDIDKHFNTLEEKLTKRIDEELTSGIIEVHRDCVKEREAYVTL